MRLTDPFPIPGRGLAPSQTIDWDAIARKVVHQSLKLQRNERIILCADPYYGGAMLDSMRYEIQRAGAIEFATILNWTPRLTTIRAPDGCKLDPEDARAEDAAMLDLFRCADVYVWLQSDWRSSLSTYAIGQSEWVLAQWQGRGLHFHWFHDPQNSDPDAEVNQRLDRVYEKAILKLDHKQLSRDMHSMAASIADTRINIRNPAGTDLSFRSGPHVHVNDGDASREKMANARSARDREEEIPCGALRVLPLIDTVEGVIAFTGGFGWPSLGYGFDIDLWLAAGLRIVFDQGRIVRLETNGDQSALDRAWAAETGDKDRLGELVVGCNPLLTPVEGTAFRPYYGFGDGVVRLTIGENIESGGQNRASVHRWLFLLDGTITAGARTLVRDGKIVPLHP
jgi:leucyl aminopeptidase (aminopeptidase T)